MGGVEVDTGSFGQLILDLNLVVANLVKSIEQGVLTEWQRSNAVELKTDSEFQTAMVGQNAVPTASTADEGPITPIANKYQSLVVETFEVGEIVVGSSVINNLDEFPILEVGGKGKGKQGKKGPGRPAKPKPKK
ncbi:unnamed protein product [Linum trigynum]|uniref:Uncharacterized protein n=1 Tax=Linum trigynum TaxID=586398 RepID=A0AAV2DUB8_9ROSI